LQNLWERTSSGVWFTVQGVAPLRREGSSAGRARKGAQPAKTPNIQRSKQNNGRRDIGDPFQRNRGLRSAEKRNKRGSGAKKKKGRGMPGGKKLGGETTARRAPRVHVRERRKKLRATGRAVTPAGKDEEKGKVFCPQRPAGIKGDGWRK